MGRTNGIVPVENFFAVLGYALASLIVVAILLELFSFITLSIDHTFHPDPLASSRSPAYEGKEWAGEFWREQKLLWGKARGSYVPFTVWGVRKWHTRYINTDETQLGILRRTIQQMGEPCRQKVVREIWVFGGSTVYGMDVPDFATIPSYLSRELNRDPQACVRVSNLGVDGYVTNQELILLIQQLKAGRRPDVVIFYDGINDAIVGAFSPGIPSGHWSLQAIQAKFQNSFESELTFVKNSYSLQLVRLVLKQFRRGPTKLNNRELFAKAQATIVNYEANLRLVRILAVAYGFKAYFFWQPVLAYGAKRLVQFEKGLKDLSDKDLGGQVQSAMAAVYRTAEFRSAHSGDFVFLGHVFDEIDEPLYADIFHLGPRGNEIIAHTIARQLQQASSSNGYTRTSGISMTRNCAVQIGSSFTISRQHWKRRTSRHKHSALISQK
jgi:lysophospholipase L1-like esterase